MLRILLGNASLLSWSPKDRVSNSSNYTHNVPLYITVLRYPFCFNLYDNHSILLAQILLKLYRRAGNLQVWNSSGLHTLIIRFTIQVCSRIILGFLLERNFWSPHCESWCGKSRYRFSPIRQQEKAGFKT